MLRLRLTQGMVDKDPESAKRSLTELSDATQSALDDLRDLARGIYPPLLADQGLAVALEAQAKKSPVDVRLARRRHRAIPAGDRGRRVLLLARGAPERREVRRRLVGHAASSGGDGTLSFAVTDDGAGFDTTRTSYGTGLQGMADRLSALGGSLNVESDRAWARPSPAVCPSRERLVVC